MLKPIARLFAYFFGLLLLAMTLLILHNNFGESAYTRDELQSAFDKSVHWLQANTQALQTDHNSMLWWMLIEAVKVQSDTTLGNVIAQYKANNIERYRNSPWSYLINGQGNPHISFHSLGNMPDYNLHFIYGFSCSRSLAYEDIIKIQNQTSFCWRNHPVSPACTTHQMMGFRFMQRTGCEEPQFVANSINTLSGYIQKQSTYDFRVVDVYLQRVLMQLDSDHQDRINPRWVKRILAHQNADGGWDNFQPLIPVGGGKYIGFTSKGMGILEPVSDFHATAQGIWILAMLMNQSAQ